MLTPEGITHLWRIVAGETDDRIATVRASNAAEASSVPIQRLEIIPEAGGTVLRVHAVFTDHDANFEWAVREVVTRDGVVIDRNVSDAGRKVLGAVWSIQVDLAMGAVA